MEDTYTSTAEASENPVPVRGNLLHSLVGRVSGLQVETSIPLGRSHGPARYRLCSVD